MFWALGGAAVQRVAQRSKRGAAWGIRQWGQQEGLCAYLAVPMRLVGRAPDHPLEATVERRDRYVGYSIANSCLVCGGVNTAWDFPMEHVTSCFGPVRGPGEAVVRPPRAAYMAAEAELARRGIGLQRGIAAQRSAQVDLGSICRSVA